MLTIFNAMLKEILNSKNKEINSFIFNLVPSVLLKLNGSSFNNAFQNLILSDEPFY